MRKTLMLLLTLSSGILYAADSSKVIRAVTDDGRQVVLNVDGTWKFTAPSQTSERSAPVADSFTKSNKATKRIAAPHGQFAVWVDPKEWKISKTEESKITLERVPAKDTQSSLVRQYQSRAAR